MKQMETEIKYCVKIMYTLVKTRKGFPQSRQKTNGALCDIIRFSTQNIRHDGKMEESHENLLKLLLELNVNWIECQHISSDWRQSLSLRRCLQPCLCVSLSGLWVCHKSEHAWMNCLPVYIGLTGGGCLGSKWYKSNYVSRTLSLSSQVYPCQTICSGNVKVGLCASNCL